MIIPDELICPEHNKVMGYSGVQPIMKQVVLNNKINYVTEQYHVWKCPSCGISLSKERENDVT